MQVNLRTVVTVKTTVDQLVNRILWDNRDVLDTRIDIVVTTGLWDVVSTSIQLRLIDHSGGFRECLYEHCDSYVCEKVAARLSEVTGWTVFSF